MQYHFSELNSTEFQELINSLLMSTYGDSIRITPIAGADGGRDGETAPFDPLYQFSEEPLDDEDYNDDILKYGRRYMFQVKHHNSVDKRHSDLRSTVLSEFRNEINNNVLSRLDEFRVNYFLLITNVPSSANAIEQVDHIAASLRAKYPYLMVEIWWKERVSTLLDQNPQIWLRFPQIFSGRKVPFIAEIYNNSTSQLPRTLKMYLEEQFREDNFVKFRQIELEQSLSKLFVDIDVEAHHHLAKLFEQIDIELQHYILHEYRKTRHGEQIASRDAYRVALRGSVSALYLLITVSDSNANSSNLLIEGGPGQGKSTVSQMLAQIYRQEVLNKQEIQPEGRWKAPKRLRLPFRIELKDYAEKMNNQPSLSVEQFLVSDILAKTGGAGMEVGDLHEIVEDSPILLILDGLDEIGNDELRDKVVDEILECIERFSQTLHSDLRTIITTRPPALAGHQEKLSSFVRLSLAQLDNPKIYDYVKRWLSVQVPDDRAEQNRIWSSFRERQQDVYVEALSRNPMQLSILLHLIRLKGDAFPTNRAQVYRSYFEIVINRDVAKSQALRQQRETIEQL